MKSLFILPVLALGANICFAQTESASATKDSAAAETPEKKNTLTLAAVYANNANYYGQKSAEATPYAAVAASYRLKSGFYFTGQTYKLLNENASGVAAASVGVLGDGLHAACQTLCCFMFNNARFGYTLSHHVTHLG